MSRYWLVVPVDTNEEGLSEWLEKSGYKPPFIEGRYPTLDEILDVVTSISKEEIRIQEKPYPGFAVRDLTKEFTILVGDPESDTFICIRGHADTNNLFKFGFPGSNSQEITMIKILHSLAKICGSLIFLHSNTATPLLILPEMDTDEALIEWRRRLEK